MSYAIGGRAGRSVLGFEIEEPGSYVFAADYPQGMEGPDVVLAIGQVSIVGTILVSLGIVFGGLIVGVLIIVRTFLKRRTSRAAVHRPEPEQAARATRTELIMAENPALSWQEAWRQAGKET